MKDFIKVTASDIHRIMQGCKGSVRFEDLVKLPRTDEAIEGETFGELLESLVHNKPLERSSKGNVFTKEMLYYANYLKLHLQKPDVQSELICSWTTSQTQVQISCRLDYTWTEDNDTTLVIPDVKYGYGIVEVKDNWQLICYAIGEVIRRKKPFKKIKLVIMQPRPHHEDGDIRTWEIDYNQLLKFKEEIEVRLLEMKQGDVTLSTGEHCRFCKAGDSRVCPARNKSFYNAVQVVMTEFKQDYMDEDALSHLMDLYSEIKSIFKIHEKSIEELVKMRIRSGKIVPNYTTKDAWSNREWNPEANVESLKALTGFDASETSMMSPSVFEKTYSVPELFMNSLTKRRIKGTTIERKNSGDIADRVFNTNNKKEGN